MKVKILINPDLFYSGHSGAIAAREAARLLDKLGFELAIFTHDPQVEKIAHYKNFTRIPYNGTANYLKTKYKESFIKVIREFEPDYVFFIGGIVNTPVVYLDICHQYRIKTVFLLLVQDFYCTRLHAGLGNNSCTLCLIKSNIHGLLNKCSEKQRSPYVHFINYQISQRLFLKRLKKVDIVLGSSEEQLGFYKQVGINESNIRKIPLFFDQKRVKKIALAVNPYFVIIGQFRHEKGIHLLAPIIDCIDDDISIKLLLFNQKEVSEFIAEYPENQKHIQCGKLEILAGVTMTNGAIELISGSKGVINPSIWATTTEFVLLEVLGLSKPIITFDVGIHKEVIKNKINGICVKAGNYEAMGQEINNLNKNPELVNSIGVQANKLYHELTDESSFTKILTSIFK
jgi:glycosyltransferase involved in cell wall biosynthesis